MEIHTRCPSCHITSCHITSCHITSHHVTSCHVMSCHVVCHFMSCHVTSYHVFSFFTTHAYGISILAVIHIAILILIHVFVHLYVCYLDSRGSLSIIFNSFTSRPVRHFRFLRKREIEGQRQSGPQFLLWWVFYNRKIIPFSIISYFSIINF